MVLQEYSQRELCALLGGSPWLDPFHPDREGEQMRKLLPILKAALEKAQEYGAHGTIGVLMDYCCLPQHPRTTAEDEALFKRGLAVRAARALGGSRRCASHSAHAPPVSKP